jgi:hypothetical protein
MWKLIEAIPFALPGARPFRRAVHNVEARSRHSGKTFRAIAGIAGQADVYVYFKGGRCIEIETKARAGRLEPEQIAWRDFCSSWEIPWLMLIEKKGETPDETVTRWLAEIRALMC